MKNVPLTSLAPVPPHDNGAVHFRAPTTLKLAGVLLDPAQPTAILRVVAGGATIEAVEGKTWEELLGGLQVPAESFVILYVANRGDVPVQVNAQLVIDDGANEATVHPAEVLPLGAAIPPTTRADARPFVATAPRAAVAGAPTTPERPRFPGMREPGRGGSGGGIMKNLGVVRHGVVDPAILSQGGPRVTGRDAENPDKVIREPAAPPPMTRGSVIRGAAANPANPMAFAGSSSVSRSPMPTRVVQSVKAPVQRAGDALPVRPVTSGTPSGASMAPNVRGFAPDTPTPGSLPRSSSEGSLNARGPGSDADHGYVPSDTLSPDSALVAPVTASAQPSDGRVTVHLMSGHALAVLAMLQGRSALRPPLRTPVLGALIRALPCVGDDVVEQRSGSIGVHLTQDERTALGHMVRAGRAAHPLAASVRVAFERALPPIQAARVG